MFAHALKVIITKLSIIQIQYTAIKWNNHIWTEYSEYYDNERKGYRLMVKKFCIKEACFYGCSAVST